jgi:hypothetical protein
VFSSLPSTRPHRGAFGTSTKALTLIMLLTLLACEEDQSPTAPADAQAQSPNLSSSATAESTEENRIPLPINQTFSGGLAFAITQTGPGRVGLFRIQNRSSTSSALDALTTAQAPALRATTDGTGEAARFLTTNTNNLEPVVEAWSEGRGPAGNFVSNNTSSNDDAIRAFKRGGSGWALDASFSGATSTTSGGAGRFIVTTNSSGLAVDASNSGQGSAGLFRILNGPNSFPAIQASTNGAGWAGEFTGTTKGIRVTTNPGGVGLQVVGGSKNAVVGTATGARALYSEEATEVWFTDYGFGRLQRGRTRILIEPGFAQTVSLDQPYHVFVQPYGDAELYVEERTALGFIVKARDGNPNADFGYRIVAKRRGFESQRLERAPWADKVVE